MSYLIACIVAISLIGGSAFADPMDAPEGSSPGERIYNMLMTKDYEYEPVKTLGLLRDMDLLFTPNDKEVASDWKEIVKRFIEAANISSNKCDLQSAFDSSMVVEFEIERWSSSLRTYINQYGNDQFKLCKPTLDSKLQKVAKEFDGEPAKNLGLLVENVVRVLTESNGKPSRPYSGDLLVQLNRMPIDSLSWGILPFMKKRAAPIAGFGWKGTDNAWFDEKFRSIVQAFCAPVADRLRMLSSIYKPFFARGMAAERDQFALGWAMGETVCRKIITNHDAVRQATYALSVQMERFNKA